jgi:hypothetical protein
MNDHSDNEERKTFQVVDRRRFDSEGNTREEQSPCAEDTSKEGSATKPTSQAQTTQRIAGEFRMESPTNQESRVNFTSFIMSLATQAMIQLGQMQAPPGLDIPLDREAGKGTIDILTMLQQKTSGNLSKEESKFLEEVLHSLRVAYVRKP